MTETMSSALWITLIGMGLVFVAILLLWGMMDLMMRLTARRAAQEQIAAEAPEECEPTPPEEAFTDLAILRRRAAAAAVAVALSIKPGQPAQSDPAPAREASSWQSVGRAAALQQRARMYSRNTR